MQSGYQSVGSIGRIGEPVYDRHNNRVKGFCTSVAESLAVTNDFIERARSIRNLNYATRLTVRFVTRNAMEPKGLLIPAQGGFYPNGFETGYMPLYGKWTGCGVQYYGENDPSRVETEGIRLEEDKLISESLRTASSRDPFSKAASGGYSIEIGLRTDRDIRKLHGLYNAVYRDYVFPLTESNITELAENPNSIVAVARSVNEIVSVAIAEVAEIPTDRGLLRISEISDEATHPSHRGNGLNQACVATVIQQLLARYGDDVHLIFEEDRACSRGVNQQSANLGFRYAGRLNRHCRIDADKDIEVAGPYEDLNVWYLPR